MDMALFRRLVDECATRWELNELHLHGFGEPLLEKAFAQRLFYAKKKAIRHVYFVTTGERLTGEMADALVRAGLDQIKFSVNGVDSESYEKLHVGLSYERVVTNIESLFATRKSRGARSPAICLQYTRSPADTSGDARFRARWEPWLDRSLGDDIYIIPFHNYGVGRGYNKVAGPPTKPCRVALDTMHVLWDGRVVPCSHDFNGAAVKGDATRQSLSAIWNGPELRALRAAHANRELSAEPLCDACDVPRL